MGKLHADWKQVKAKAKHVDTVALFKLNLGKALDKWEAVWEKLEPKVKAKSLTLAELEASSSMLEPFVGKVQEIYHKYRELIAAEGRKNKEKHNKATDPKEKAKLVARAQELKDLLLETGELQLKVTGGLLWLKDRRHASDWLEPS